MIESSPSLSSGGFCRGQGGKLPPNPFRAKMASLSQKQKVSFFIMINSSFSKPNSVMCTLTEKGRTTYCLPAVMAPHSCYIRRPFNWFVPPQRNGTSATVFIIITINTVTIILQLSAQIIGINNDVTSLYFSIMNRNLGDHL